MNYDEADDLLYMPFIILRNVPCTPSLFRAFNHKGTFDFIKYIFTFIKMTMNLCFFY